MRTKSASCHRKHRISERQNQKHVSLAQPSYYSLDALPLAPFHPSFASYYPFHCTTSAESNPDLLIEILPAIDRSIVPGKKTDPTVIPGNCFLKESILLSGINHSSRLPFLSTYNYFPQKAVCDIGMQIFFVLFIKTDKTESLRPRILQSFCQIGARKTL